MKTLLNVNPHVLKWAREEAGCSIDTIAGKLAVSRETYVEWETTGERIPFATLRALAASYRRQIATFFLSEIPPKIKRPKDYRNLSVAGRSLSKDTLLAFRRVRRYQQILVDIHGRDSFDNKYVWLKDMQTELLKGMEVDQQAYWLRNKLKFPFEEQVKEKDSEACYRRWRHSFARELGVFSFQFSLPPEETQGFSYSDDIPFCIAINSNGYSANSRIFTLFHEFSHLLQHQSGVCTPDRVDKQQHLEYEINRSAGALLIPQDRVARILDPDGIFMIAKKLKVSSEAYLRRMHDLGRVSEAEFVYLLREVRDRVKPSKRDGFALGPVQKCIAAKGQLFYDSVVTGAKNGVISYSRASEVLGLKANHFIYE